MHVIYSIDGLKIARKLMSKVVFSWLVMLTLYGLDGKSMHSYIAFGVFSDKNNNIFKRVN